jgi:hypothetical protein
VTAHISNERDRWRRCTRYRSASPARGLALQGQSRTTVYGFLQGLCNAYGVAIVLTGHDRKSGGGRDDEAASGTMQWAGQADQTLTIANTRKIES